MRKGCNELPATLPPALLESARARMAGGAAALAQHYKAQDGARGGGGSDLDAMLGLGILSLSLSLTRSLPRFLAFSLFGALSLSCS